MCGGRVRFSSCPEGSRAAYGALYWLSGHTQPRTKLHRNTHVTAQRQSHTFKTHRRKARRPGELERLRDVVCEYNPVTSAISTALCRLPPTPGYLGSRSSWRLLLWHNYKGTHYQRERERKKRQKVGWRHGEGEEERQHEREWARNRWKEEQKGWRDGGEMGAGERESESWNDNGKSPSVSQYAGRQPRGATVWYEYQEAGWLGEILDWITSPAPSAALLACRRSFERESKRHTHTHTQKAGEGGAGWRSDSWGEVEERARAARGKMSELFICVLRGKRHRR